MSMDLSDPIERVVHQLAEEFKGIYSLETIRDYLAESEKLLEKPKVATFVPLLLHRFTRERLRAVGQVEGRIRKDAPEVLFVCVHNAGRSQMAAALLDRLSEGRVHVRSAGSTPASEINPAVVQVMTERGLDLSKEFPKPLTDEVVRAADVVITMGCGDSCPIYPGKRYMDWEVEDPAGQPAEVVRRIADDIEGRIRSLIREPDVIPA
jgi:protein-tyrosine-phosphatase